MFQNLSHSLSIILPSLWYFWRNTEYVRCEKYQHIDSSVWGFTLEEDEKKSHLNVLSTGRQEAELGMKARFPEKYLSK